MKISLGMPVYDAIKVETVMSLMVALREIPHEIHLNFRKGTYLHDNRNEIVREAFAVGADYLMFIDADLTFYPDAINRLLAHQKDIVGGAYNMKQVPPTSTIKLADENGNLIASDGANIPNELFKVFAVPTGFMLIRLEAIRNMKKPFDFGENEDGSLIGEDVNFCKRAQKELGIEIWCDPTLKIGHIGEYLY